MFRHCWNSTRLASTEEVLSIVRWKCPPASVTSFTNIRNSKTFSTMSANGQQKLLNIDTVNPAVKKVEYAVRGPIVIRASEIEKELAKGVKKPFSNVIKANIGDCHAMGQKPITFIRQVLAACTCPDLIETSVFPADVNERAKKILSTIRGSTGCYSDSVGLALVRESVANYIAKRDGYPASASNILVTNGASSSVKLILELFISSGGKKTGVMIPIPQYPLYSATVDEFSMEQVGYYLDEANGWSLDIAELKRSVDEARKHCNPRVLCVINPGNPTGQVLTYQNIQEIIRFAMRERLFLMADEVYQDNVYAEGSAFHSFKKVLRDMGTIGDDFQMASFHSCSKGFMGECGLRGGYVEVLGLDANVQYQLNKLQSAQLGSNVTGQLVLDCILNPPKEGEPSYNLFMKEKSAVLGSLKDRAKLVYERLNKIEGISCNPVMGAMYAFPQIFLPPKAVEAARSLGHEPDFYYCLQLLEQTGICVVPGSGFRQKEGTWHFRMTILPPMEELVVFIQRFEAFHKKFMKEYQ